MTSIEALQKQFTDNLKHYMPSFVADLFKGLNVNDEDKENYRIQFNNELLSYAVYATPPQSGLLKAIFDARKKAILDEKNNADLLAEFIYFQLSFLRKLTAPIVDREKNTSEDNIVSRELTRADMKAYIDQTIAHIGIADEHKVTVYSKINELMRETDTNIIEARTVAITKRAGFDSTITTPFTALKTTLVSAEPDDKIISENINTLADYNTHKTVGAKTLMIQKVSNLSKVLLELHDEPFMQSNGFARAKFYNQLIDILMQLDEDALNEEIANDKANLGEGWFDDIRDRFSIWSGYRKYCRAKDYADQWIGSSSHLIALIADEIKEPKYQHLAGQPFLEIKDGLAFARVAKNRNRTLNKLRPTLLALGSMTSLGFAIAAVLGATTVAFFGLALFSNPFVLPSIIIAFATFSLVRALYHLSNKSKLELDREINLEHDSMVYHDFDDNPNTHLESQAKWPVVSWVWKKLSLLKNPILNHVNLTLPKYVYILPALVIVPITIAIVVPIMVIAAIPDLIQQLGVKLKRDHKNMFKELVNFLPIFCMLIAVGFVLNHFLPGFFDFATNFNLKDTLTPGVDGGGNNAFVERTLAAGLPLMAFGAVSKLGGSIIRWGWNHDSKVAQFFGTVLSKTGDRLSQISIALMALGAVRFMLPFIPALPAAIVSTALSLTVLVVVFVGSICGQLYTNFIDARRGKKAQDSDHLEVEPGLYVPPTPTSCNMFENKDPMAGMMTKMYENMNGNASKKPDKNINEYYKLPEATAN